MTSSQNKLVQCIYCGPIFQVFLFLFGLTSPASGADGPLEIFTELSFADSRIEERGGEQVVAGFATDLVRAVLLEAGLEADIQMVPWPRLLQSVQNQPNSLAYGMARTPIREDRYHWIGQIRPMVFKLWGLKEREQELPRTLAAARDLRVSATRGDVVTEYLVEQGFTNLVYMRSSSSTYQMLLRGRIDAIPYSAFGIGEYMKNNNIPEGTLVDLLSLDNISTGNYLVMNKDSDPDLVAAFSAAFQAVVESGEYQRIMGPSLDP